MFHLERFKVLPQSELSQEAFAHYPVWSEFYDYEELEEIENWGLERETVWGLISQNSPGNEHAIYTLLETNPFPERMRIFILAELRTKNDLCLSGHIMNENAFCLTVFHGNSHFTFSRHPMLEEENDVRAKGLARELGALKHEVFPIAYSTEFTSRTGVRIEGAFTYGGAET